MSNPRTFEEFVDRINFQSAWRKKELSAYKNRIDSSSGPERVTLIRGAITMLYAHWEGFTKESGRVYLMLVSELVKRRKLTFKDLPVNILSACIWSDANLKEPSLRSLVEHLDERFNLKIGLEIPIDGILRTRSNLNSHALKEIICVLGINYLPYASKEKFLDERLLDARNAIAHGEFKIIEIADYLDFHGAVIELIDMFKNDIENVGSIWFTP